MANNGNLIAAHPGNQNAARHGLFSDDVLSAEISDHREVLARLPWMIEADAVALDEVARLVGARGSTGSR